MRIVKNEEFIKQRTKLTQRGSLVGMGLLIGSLVISSRYPLISWALLIVGFIVAMTAVRAGNRYVRPPRPDLLLDKLLKGLDKRFTMFHYVAPAEHLLLTPSGLVAILTRGQQGEIATQGSRWRQRSLWQNAKLFFGDLPLGNPSRELRSQLARTRRTLSKYLGDGSIPLDGVILFYSDRARLQVQEPEFPVWRADEFKVNLRAMLDGRPALTSETRQRLVVLLRGEKPETESEES